jgi:transcriptional regulator with XRE-family HTH domain
LTNKKNKKKMPEKNIYILIGSRIKNIRENKGITQQQISDICDFEKSTVSRIEAGRTNITIKTLYKLSQSLGVEMKDLVDI